MPKSKKLDKTFFGPDGRNSGHLSRAFNYQYTEQGKQLSGRKARTMVALENGLDPKDVARLSAASNNEHPRSTRFGAVTWDPDSMSTSKLLSCRRCKM